MVNIFTYRPERVNSANRMAQFDASEAGLRNFKDFLSIYNQMSEMCFNRCVINLNHRQLSEEEQVCSDVCAEKQMKYNNRIMGVYVVEQPIATERKMKEAEAQANTVMNKLKEHGVDVDNLSQEELMQEAMKLHANS